MVINGTKNDFFYFFQVGKQKRIRVQNLMRIVSITEVVQKGRDRLECVEMCSVSVTQFAVFVCLCCIVARASPYRLS